MQGALDRTHEEFWKPCLQMKSSRTVCSVQPTQRRPRNNLIPWGLHKSGKPTLDRGLFTSKTHWPAKSRFPSRQDLKGEINLSKARNGRPPALPKSQKNPKPEQAPLKRTKHPLAHPSLEVFMPRLDVSF